MIVKSEVLEKELLMNNIDSIKEMEKQFVWMKGISVPGLDPRAWRKDKLNSLMKYSDHGLRQSPFGW